MLNKGTTGTIFYNVFGMTPSLTGDWTRDLPHTMPALYHYDIEEAVFSVVNIDKVNNLISVYITSEKTYP